MEEGQTSGQSSVFSISVCGIKVTTRLALAFLERLFTSSGGKVNRTDFSTFNHSFGAWPPEGATVDGLLTGLVKVFTVDTFGVETQNPHLLTAPPCGGFC